MKRILILLTVLALSLAVVACSKEEAQEAATTQATEEGFYTEYDGPTPMDEASMMIGEPVEDLITLIGAPERIEHYPSAMNEGDEMTMEEGWYYYSDFVVYTIKEGETELIYGVEYRGEN